MTGLFVPPYLLRHIVRSGSVAAGPSDQTLRVDAVIRGRRTARFAAPQTDEAKAVKRRKTDRMWQVYDAQHGGTLPGVPVRASGDPAIGDDAVDEAANGIMATFSLFRDIYGHRSFDGRGTTVPLSVHFERNYNNAFWDGARLVFGDGDGEIFERFTKPIDVLAHEFAHAVTQHTTRLVYHDQPGALNESISDVFAACLKQRMLKQTAREADWLIGEGLFRPDVQARALRDMANPGTAYDDPRLGQDPQVGHLSDYVESSDDHGGVHINSGIPNKAFQNAAISLGGTSWDGIGAIWYDALMSGDVSPTSTFAEFADATLTAAARLSRLATAAVEDGWRRVGVLTSAASAEPVAARTPTEQGSLEPVPVPVPVSVPVSVPGQRAARPEELVIVRRSGGFVGRPRSGEVNLASDDPRAPRVREIVEQVDLATARAGEPMPDMYSYTFEVCGSAPVCIPEQNLTAPLRALADLVLERPGY